MGSWPLPDDLPSLEEVVTDAMRTAGRIEALLATDVDVERYPITPFIKASLAPVQELIEGVAGEAAAKREANVCRLARHILETEIQFDYIIADPGPRMEQWLGSYARWYTLIYPEGTRPKLMRKLYADTKRRTRDDAKLAARLGRKLRPGEGRFLPSYEQMADLMNRGGDYQYAYRLLSQKSHPGMWGLGRYIRADPLSQIRGQADPKRLVYSRRSDDRGVRYWTARSIGSASRMLTEGSRLMGLSDAPPGQSGGATG